MTEHDLVFTPAIALAEAIRQRRVSPVEVMDAVLARIEATQPRLNAFVTVTGERAREEAKAAEDRVMRGLSQGPLNGVPFSVKDLTWTKGVRTTMGSVAFVDFVPDEDAVPVARLKAAGAILIGKTTTPEFGHKPFTESPLFGLTVNPWDLGRHAGGSSGGAGVAVAAGLGPLALGTDGGGSIRIPSSLCGVVGHKATLGRVPHIHAPDLFGNNSYIGPMTRTVADAKFAFDIMAGPDPRDPYSTGFPATYPTLPADGLKGVRIGWLPRAGNTAVNPEVMANAEACVRIFESMGAAVEPASFDFVAYEPVFHAILQSGAAVRLMRLLSDYAAHMDRTMIDTIMKGSRYTAEQVHLAMQARGQLFQRLQRFFAGHDFLLSPTTAAPAVSVAVCDPYASFQIDGQDVGSMRAAWYPYTYPFNLSGHPAMAVPSGFTEAGLPTSLQIVGPWHGDERVFALAARLEAARPWADRRPRI
jgi:aspartyl-tRNA(Asn)/glutamyl-tRNA(Gln) amidotransferase subunit A